MSHCGLANFYLSLSAELSTMQPVYRMEVFNEDYFLGFIRLMPFELWLLVADECIDEWWSDANLCIAMGLNFYQLRRFNYTVNKRKHF